MKILGLTHFNHAIQQYMKPDSALLVNNKPFFLPDFSHALAMYPCLVVRINRLGRNVEQRFAHRYYDAWTIGLNMCALDLLQVASEQGNNYTNGIAFDNSLVVGEFTSLEVPKVGTLLHNEQPYVELTDEQLIATIDEAIEQITRFVTIRMGDMIAIDFIGEPIQLTSNEKWQAKIGNNEILSCRIK